ncbi:MAG TPA: HEAT repeat domain-containing protein [Gemmatimonadales bacterium]|nr:HEAT repeat domain-containing protein [Gemmatimonadales bacterium]
MSCSNPRQTRFVSSLLLPLALLAAPLLRGQQPNETTVGVLAGLLAAADARHFDAAALREALSHSDPAIRRQGALAAGRIGDPAALDLLFPILNDSVPGVQSAAAFALGLLKDARAVAPLLQLIRSVPSTDQRAPQREAVTAIAKISGDEGTRALSDIIAGGSPEAATPVINAALLEAWRLGPRAPITQLVRFADATDPQTRWPALYSLARLRAAPGAAALIRGLRDGDPQIRTVAARGISKALLDSARIDVRGAIDGLRPLLDDRDPHIRINALRALASFRDSSLAGAVVPGAADRDIGVAVQAETTLGVLRGSAAIEALRARLTSSVFAVKRQALIALAQADSTAGVTAAAVVTGDADWRWRSVAAEAFGAARARDRLEAQLADPDGRVVAQALQALQRIVPAADSALLARAHALITHADPAVRSVAADLLARHPSTDDVDLLVAAYTRAEGDPFNDARLSAVSALGAIAAASPSGRLRVATKFISVLPRPDDYLVRRLAADTLPDTRDAWGPAMPIATGRTVADYRDVARRWLAPALGGTNPHIFIETDRGTLEIELLPAEAPLTVAAFINLVDRRYFDGTRWHRVVPNFVVQDGDPRGDGWGGPGGGFVLRDEINPLRYQTGSVGMALSGPDTGGSQYFITHSAQPHLDGTYTIFGRVTGGSTVLDAIGQGDRIRSIHR